MIAMLKIEVNLDTSEVKAALDRLNHAMGDTTPLMMELAQIMSESTDRAFENETDPVTGRSGPNSIRTTKPGSRRTVIPAPCSSATAP